MSFNETSECRVFKMVFNVPKGWEKMIRKRTSMETEYCGQYGTWLRELVKMDLEEYNTVMDRPISQDDLKERESQGQVYYPDPARKYEGFRAGRYRNSFVNNWANNKQNV